MVVNHSTLLRPSAYSTVSTERNSITVHSVADPYHFDTDPDPDPGCEKIRYGSGSGSRVSFDTDPDPGKKDTDPDPASTRTKYQENLQKVYEKRS